MSKSREKMGFEASREFVWSNKVKIGLCGALKKTPEQFSLWLSLHWIYILVEDT